jgi:hypothetical protein
MGLTPLEGLVMGTRCGDLDPAIHFYLAKNLGMDNQALDDLLNRRSGLLGLCGVNDMREIHRRIAQGDPTAALALDVFCHRLRKYLGAYWIELGRLDALVFTGGIGENDAVVRARTCVGLEGMGILLDEEANQAGGQGERRVSRRTARWPCWSSPLTRNWRSPARPWRPWGGIGWQAVPPAGGSRVCLHGGGRREYVLVGLPPASLLATPPPEATRPSLYLARPGSVILRTAPPSPVPLAPFPSPKRGLGERVCMAKAHILRNFSLK